MDIFDGSFMCGRSHDIGTNPITRDTIHGSSKCLADTATKRQTQCCSSKCRCFNLFQCRGKPLCFNAASQFSQRFSEDTKWISRFFFEAKLFFCLNMSCYTFVYHFLKGNMTHMLHVKNICQHLPPKWPSLTNFVGIYSSTMEHLGDDQLQGGAP